ncbi:hypothetical protein C440_14709 [Haloferax mucosum ATCC BAA-1512]|uniref:Uncharacterized protein n=1 Tax=Haloferax mucosum ATCC BAA-1512 TaxID=662479 RepID=M0I809_9EURY|nr:hypothetical protein C440_14709 [Haloferax mucosum ATCC BAA-1512]
MLWPETSFVWTGVSTTTLGLACALARQKAVFYVFMGYAYVLLLWGAVRIGRHAITKHEPL